MWGSLNVIGAATGDVGGSAAILCGMADIEPASADEGGRKVTVYQLDDKGKPTAQLGTATIILPTAVVLDFPMETLKLPLGISALPDAVQDAEDGHRRTDRSRLFNVASVHLSEPGSFQDMEGPDGLPKSDEPRWALEISRPSLIPPPPRVGYSARSFWCILFPRLQACNPH